VNNALEVNGIAKSYGSLQVLESVSFTVPVGQALGIVGPNGAGKSTLLSIINGNEKASAGSILIHGKDATNTESEARARLGIGRTFQIPRPFKDLTVFENALTGSIFGAGLGRKAAEEKALEALEVSGLMPYANELAGRLPLLARKRLELARALATDPNILLLDEIAGGLTEAECDSLVQTISQLRDSGMTIIWIEHVVQALTAVVSRLVCLSSGTLIADGKPKEVMQSSAVLDVYLGTGVK
jgi:branched-chain amino acid transport system ATP-binding protein